MNPVVFTVDTTKLFDKKYTKLVKKNPLIGIKFLKFIDLLTLDPKYPSLKSHQIDHSEYGKVWSSWVHDDLRVLWKYEGEVIVILLLLLDIGSHDEVY
jgi:mRNA-degrading endonuclease YafQ of YafQ-DinJ toxin-antitoxin module